MGDTYAIFVTSRVRTETRASSASVLHVYTSLRAGVARSGQPIKTLNDKFSPVRKHRSSKRHMVKHGLDWTSKTWTGLISKTWTGLKSPD